MGYGDCFVASDLPEMSDVVGDSALHFPSGDTEKLPLRLQELVDSPVTVRVYKKKTPERVSWLFSCEDIWAQHERLYQDLGSRRNVRSFAVE